MARIWEIKAVAIALFCAAVSPSTRSNAHSIGLLYNPGPIWKAGLTLVQTPTGQSCSLVGSSMEQVAHLKNDLKGRPHVYQCFDGLLSTQGKDGWVSYNNDTRAGWSALDAGNNPGWNIVASGGTGRSQKIRYTNLAAKSIVSCQLREVGLVYQGWPDGAESAIRLSRDLTRFKFGDFRQIYSTLSFRVVKASPTKNCGEFTTSYITVDFRVEYLQGDAIIRSDLVGVILYVAPGSRDSLILNDDPAIYWKGETSRNHIVLLRGSTIGIYSRENNSKYRRILVDYSKLEKYFPAPPSGYRLADAIVTGLDVYSAVRGADLIFDVKDVNLIGVK